MLSHKDEGGVEQILSIHFTGGGGGPHPPLDVSICN